MIEIVVDDLAFVEADAVVRAADAGLDPVTPAMAHLDRCGGARFAEQRRLTNPLDVGAAVVTGGGDLAAPYVIHVVIQSREIAADRQTVRRALAAARRQAADWRLASVATPVIGAGAGGISLEEGVELIVESFSGNAGPGPARVCIVVERDAERAIAEAIVRRRGG